MGSAPTNYERPKLKHLKIPLTPDERFQINQAAHELGMNITDFVKLVALTAARSNA